MPFKRMKDGSFKTRNGKRMTRRQVNAYHATKGFTKPYKGYKRKKR